MPPPGAVLVGAVVALGAGRLAVQASGDVSLALVGVTTAVGLLAFALATVAVHRHTPEGSTGIAAACTLGLAVDTLIRATSTTWDIVWRQDPVAWVLAAAVVGAVAAVTLTAAGVGSYPTATMVVVPSPRSCCGPISTWPSSTRRARRSWTPRGVSYPVGLALALGAAALALVVIVAVARHGLPRFAAAGLAVGLAVVVFVLPIATGAAVIVLAVLAQAAAPHCSARPPARTATRSATALPPRPPPSPGVGCGSPPPCSCSPSTPCSPCRSPTASCPPRSACRWPSPCSPRRARGRRPGSPAGCAGRCRWWWPRPVVVAPLVVAASWPATTHSDVAARPIRVLTFNIEQGLTLGQLHLEQMAQFVDDAGPDVVVMEEVGRGWSLSGMTDDAEWFSRRLGMPYAWSPAADHQFGNVVFSRLPITDEQVLALGKGNGTQDRSAVFVTLDVGGGGDLTVIGTHLMNGSQPSMHESRAQAYRYILDRWGGRSRTVLLGDLNTYPRDVPPGWPELDIPLDAGFGTNQDLDQCTMPTSNQNCPDWIFTTGDLGLSPVTVVVDRPDHRPITAEVSLRR